MPATIQTIHKPTRARGLDTSGNNNHAQIYSGRALEFDGVSDYLTADSAASLADSDFTAALWIKPTLDDYDDGPGGRILFSFHEGVANNRLFFYIVEGDNNIRGYSVSGADQSNTNSALSGSWERLVITKEGTSLKFYRNGTADGTSTLQDTVSGSEKFSIGSEWDAGPVASDFYLGMMSDFQMWNSVWTADDVTYDYLNPEQLALNRGGTSLTNSNLKLWYPMNDGHRGQQSFVLDASNTGLGDDLVNWSSTFNASGTSTDDFGDWDTNANDSTTFCTFDHDNKTIRLRTTDGTHVQAFYTPDILKIDTTYKFEVTVSEIISGSVRVRPQNASGYSVITEVGTYSYAITPSADVDGSDNLTDLDFRIERHSGVSDFTVSDVKIYPINDKNNATTVFYGEEQITDPKNQTGFASHDWIHYGSASGNINVSDSKLFITCNSSAGAQDNQGAQLAIASVDAAGGSHPIVAGRTYRIQADLDFTTIADSDLVIKFVLGNVGTVITASDGAPNDGTIDATEQTYYADVTTGDATGNLRINCTAASNDSGSDNIFSVDNVSVKEIGTAMGWTDADQQLDIPQTALQSYNQLAWFNGNGDTLTVTEFDFTTGQTINMWLNPAELESYRSIFGDEDTKNYMRYDDGSETKIFQFEPNESVTPLQIACGGETRIIKDKWRMYTFIWNTDRTMDVHFNGDLVGSSSATNDSTNGKTMKITKFGAGYDTAANFFQGAMTEISHYTDVLTQAELDDLYNDGKAKSALEASGSGGLSAYWRNNGLAQWDDLKGSNNGTVTCSETMLITAGVDSSRDSQGFLMNRQRTTNSLNLYNHSGMADGDWTHALVPSSGDDDLAFIGVGDAFSVSCWVKCSELPSSTSAILSRNDNTNGWRVRLTSANKLQIQVEENGTVKTGVTDNAISVNTWYHIVGTFDGDPSNNGSGVVRLYLNGVTGGSTTNTDSDANDMDVSSSKDHVYIGMHQSSNQDGFMGEIDDIAIYNDVLEQTEVTRNYNAGKRSHR